jgi:TolB-like protein/DNA-binding winged helix-turn-helix (wHTH) protein
LDTQQQELDTGFRIHEWHVQPRQCLLESDATQEYLEPRAMQVLLYLALRQGKVVHADELSEHVWGNADPYEELPHIIARLRAHLGDDFRSPRFIQTIPKIGYRFVAEVQPAPLPEPDPGLVDPTRPGTARRAKRRRLALTLVLAVAVLIALVFSGRGKEPLPPVPPAPPAAELALRDWFDTLLLDGREARELIAVAVLPFSDISDGERLPYLDEAITEEVARALARVGGLVVVSRRSTAALHENLLGERAVGQGLDVSLIVEGKIRRSQGRLRTSVRISSTNAGDILFAGHFDIAPGELPQLQRRFLELVGDQLAPHQAEIAPAAAEIADAAAYDALLQARYLVKQRGEDSLRRAIALLEDAVNREPDFDRARLSLARALALLPHYSAQEDEEALYARALQQLERVAMDDDEERARAESLRAFIADRRRDWRVAEEHHRRALALDPVDANTYIWYAQHLASTGRLRDALDASQRARDLDAASPVVKNRLAIDHLWNGGNSYAAGYFAIAAELGFRNHLNPAYFVFLHREKRWKESRRLLERMLRIKQSDAGWLDALYSFLESGTGRSRAISALRDAIALGNVPPRMTLGMWLLLGEVDEAYRYIESSRDDPRNLDVEFLFTAEAAAFRADPRFAALARSLGLQDYWDQYGPPDAMP